jgi:hypothetical protein
MAVFAFSLSDVDVVLVKDGEDQLDRSREK